MTQDHQRLCFSTMSFIYFRFSCLCNLFVPTQRSHQHPPPSPTPPPSFRESLFKYSQQNRKIWLNTPLTNIFDELSIQFSLSDWYTILRSISFFASDGSSINFISVLFFFFSFWVYNPLIHLFVFKHVFITKWLWNLCKCINTDTFAYFKCYYVAFIFPSQLEGFLMTYPPLICSTCER